MISDTEGSSTVQVDSNMSEAEFRALLQDSLEHLSDIELQQAWAELQLYAYRKSLH
jgi:hypothetical protein